MATNGDEGPAFFVGLILGLAVGGLISGFAVAAGWAGTEAALKKAAIERGCAHYDEKTGVWKWSGDDGK